MNRISDHKKEDGSIDWESYRAAEKIENQIEVNEGKRCSDCGRYIIFAKGYPSLCGDCKSLRRDSDSVTHNRFVRCPECRETMEPEDIYEEGSHDIYCEHCDHEFTVITHISFSFKSPALGTTGNDDD